MGWKFDSLVLSMAEYWWKSDSLILYFGSYSSLVISETFMAILADAVLPVHPCSDGRMNFIKNHGLNIT